jgi:hypothetical protein
MMMGRCTCDRDFPVRRCFKECWHLARISPKFLVNANPTFLNRLLCILAEGFSVHCIFYNCHLFDPHDPVKRACVFVQTSHTYSKLIFNSMYTSPYTECMLNLVTYQWLFIRSKYIIITFLSDVCK